MSKASLVPVALKLDVDELTKMLVRSFPRYLYSADLGLWLFCGAEDI